MRPDIKELYDKARFSIKLPFILILIVLGFMFEYVISLPMLILCELQNLFRKNHADDENE